MKESFGNFLVRMHVEYMGRTGKRLSQNEYARTVVGVSPATFSQWATDSRLPTGENIEILAKVYGEEIYDRLGLDRPMPKNPILREIIKELADASDTEQQEVLEIVQRMRQPEENSNPGNSSPAFSG